LNDVEDLTKIASWNLQDLQFLIHPHRDRRGANRSPTSEVDETIRNQNIFSNLQKHTAAFQKLGDYIAGREDWSKLTPRTPRAPSVSPDSASRLQPAEPSKVTISMPASPYQPFMEEAEDDGDGEELKSNVEHVHYVPKDDSPVTPATKSGSRRVIPPQTPPQVVIRQATDPRQFESPKRRADAPSSPLRTSADADEDTEIPEYEGTKGSNQTHLHPSALPKLVTKLDRPSKTLKDLEEEISRLHSELQRYAESEASASDVHRPDLGKRKTSKHKSVDLGHAEEAAATSSSRRPRALTAQGTERPRSFVEGSSYDPYRSEMPPPPRPDLLHRTSSTKSRRPPSRSPRTTSYSAVDSQAETYWDHGYAQNTGDMYGPDPRSSLPTVLESGKRDKRSSRSGQRGKRVSGVFEDPPDNFHDFFRQEDPTSADFPLFGPTATQAPPQVQPRSRGNSRAQDTSPNSKPYISPHQLHESLPIEADVREINVSLEDMYFGTVKKFKVRRQKYNAQTGIVTTEERIFEVPINRGLKPGSKIKFESGGDQTPEGTKELHFKLSEVSP
jgi:hypothetical protein